MMPSLTVQDNVDLIKLFYKNGENITATIRAFCTARGIRSSKEAPVYNTVKAMIMRFQKTSSCLAEPHSRRSRGEGDVDDVLEIVQENPNTSTRAIANQCHFSKSKVHSILEKDLNFRAFKPKLERFLSETAVQERLEFCEKFLDAVRDSETFLENVLFTDEAMFELNPSFNRQNCRFWGSERPANSSFVVKQFPKKLMVWIGFSKHVIVGPYFFDTSVNADSYLDMICNFVIPELKRRRKYSSTIFQQDGATPHTAKKTIEYLNKMFPNRLISRGTSFGWPGYSPDLSPVDFSFWGYVKAAVCGRSYSDIDSLKTAITDFVATCSSEYFANCVDNMTTRCQLCLENDGDLFE